jgi:Protein of unknown function (DUF4240)
MTLVADSRFRYEWLMATKSAMSRRDFWAVIAKLNWKKTGDDDAVLGPAVKALAAKSEAQIRAFADLLAEALHALDTREHARHSSDDFDPDDGDAYLAADGFLYARACVVANGEEFYEAVLSTPSKMPKDMDFESLLSLATMAWEAKTGDEFDHLSPVDFETFANKKGWAPTKKTRAGKFTGKNVPPGNRRPT